MKSLDVDGEYTQAIYLGLRFILVGAFLTGIRRFCAYAKGAIEDRESSLQCFHNSATHPIRALASIHTDFRCSLGLSLPLPLLLLLL
jgi:hypothetical protein